MSGLEESSLSGEESDVEEVTMYRCRECPGQEFTAAERDLHRQQHPKDKKKGAKSGRDREGSPDSAPTLFEPIPQNDKSSDESSASTLIRGGKGGIGNGRKTKPGPMSSKNRPEKIRKIRSKKKFDRHIEQPKSDGG